MLRVVLLLVSSMVICCQSAMANSPGVLGVTISYGQGSSNAHRDVYNEIRKMVFGDSGKSEINSIGLYAGVRSNRRFSSVINFNYSTAVSEASDNEFKLRHERRSILASIELKYFWHNFFVLGQIGYDFIMSDDLFFEAITGVQNIDTQYRFYNFKDFGFYDTGLGLSIGRFLFFFKRRNNKHFVLKEADFYIGGVSYGMQ